MKMNMYEVKPALDLTVEIHEHDAFM